MGTNSFLKVLPEMVTFLRVAELGSFSAAADLLGMNDRLGRIAPGFTADLVAVEGNPLQTMDALFTGVRLVMKDGKIVVDKR